MLLTSFFFFLHKKGNLSESELSAWTLKVEILVIKYPDRMDQILIFPIINATSETEVMSCVVKKKKREKHV